MNHLFLSGTRGVVMQGHYTGLTLPSISYFAFYLCILCCVVFDIHPGPILASKDMHVVFQENGKKGQNI